MRPPGTPREDRPERPVGPRLVTLAAVGAALAGGVIVWAALDRARRDAPLDDVFVAWAGLALVLVTAAVVSAEVGRREADHVESVRPADWRAANRRTAIAAVGVVVVALLPLVRDSGAGTLRGLVLTLTAGAGAIPVVRACFGLTTAVRAGPGDADIGRQVADSLLFREVAMGLLRPLGALVAIATLALATTRLDVTTGPHPAAGTTVLLFGLTGTAAVAAVYNGPRAAIRSDARRLRDVLAPTDGSDLEELRSQLRQREDVNRQLGLTATLLSDLQAGAWITGPLLAAATGLLLTTG
ncbi:hypothetical protein OEB99_12600 [Actinotalea sp. M2MS4P-6]|uniref:hypothetical protein n=1 Tax=Actinotalea sp. M2MS4P-6 TaxID=2983762 RepID=UPI0021E3E248|nr:hypothetical protein [Actinotalea sp. M2MS4P-6]MCV2395149.1 hypothetical protein [Actinotalea sp. M2MS4P-6]